MPAWSLVIAAVLGLALLVRGWRGRRVDDHPLCRRCRYDLHRSAVAPAACPECGVNLMRWRGVRVGNRRRRPLTLAFGTMLLMASLAVATLTVWTAVRGIDLNTYKPLWLLKHEANGPKVARAKAAAVEIIARLKTDQLDDADIGAIVDHAMALQSDRHAPWCAWWGDFIEEAWMKGDIDDDTAERYVRGAIDGATTLLVRSKAHQDQPFWLYASHHPQRAGSGGRLIAVVQHFPIAPGSKQERGSRYAIEIGGSGAARPTHDIWPGCGSETVADRSIGKHTAVLELDYRVLTPSRPLPLIGWSTTMQRDFEIVYPEDQTIEAVQDATLAPLIQRAVRVQRCYGLTMDDGTTQLVCNVEIMQPPMPVAFEVLLRIDGVEWLVSRTASLHGPLAPSESDDIDPPTIILDQPSRPRTVEVILRTDLELASRMPFDRVWDGEIVMEKVPFTIVTPDASRRGQ